MRNYGIREDYEARSSAETFVENPFDYWNDERRSTAAVYQHHVYERAASIVSKPGECHVADVGCGYPRKARTLLAPRATSLTLFDQPSMQSLVERDFPEMDFIPTNLESPDEGHDARFDCVVCADVIEHLLDPDPLVTFIARICKPGGTIVLSTPERDIERGPGCLSSPKPEHVREWNSGEFVRYLEHHGLEVVGHSLLPKGRLRGLRRLLVPFGTRLKTPLYSSCQMAICRPARGV